MLIHWKPTSLNSFTTTRNGVVIVLDQDALGKWKFTANGETVAGEWHTSKAAMQSAERVAEGQLKKAMDTRPVALQGRLDGGVLRRPGKSEYGAFRVALATMEPSERQVKRAKKSFLRAVVANKPHANATRYEHLDKKGKR